MPDRSCGYHFSWFTFRVRGRDDDPVGTPRRALLISGMAAATATLAGCWTPGGSGADPGARSSAHPLSAVLSGTLALVARYDATVAAQPGLAGRLAPLRAEHWTHVTALDAAMGRAVPSGPPDPATSTPGPADARAALAALRTAERSAQADAVTACLAAPAGYAALLGSIAACRATHLEVLT
jgi:predicted small secreted protein